MTPIDRITEEDMDNILSSTEFKPLVRHGTGMNLNGVVYNPTLILAYTYDGGVPEVHGVTFRLELNPGARDVRRTSLTLPIQDDLRQVPFEDYCIRATKDLTPNNTLTEADTYKLFNPIWAHLLRDELK